MFIREGHAVRSGLLFSRVGMNVTDFCVWVFLFKFPQLPFCWSMGKN